jgi:hypothetical protein
LSGAKLWHIAQIKKSKEKMDVEIDVQLVTLAMLRGRPVWEEFTLRVLERLFRAVFDPPIPEYAGTEFITTYYTFLYCSARGLIYCSVRCIWPMNPSE